MAIALRHRLRTLCTAIAYGRPLASRALLHDSAPSDVAAFIRRIGDDACSARTVAVVDFNLGHAMAILSAQDSTNKRFADTARHAFDRSIR